jgi:phospholipid-binding lipoprotein MlaA
VIRRSVSARAAALAFAAALALAGSGAAAEPDAAATPDAEVAAPDVASPVGEIAAPDAEAAPPDSDVGAPEPHPSDSHVVDSETEDLLLEYEEVVGEDDPLEPSNRVMFGANETVYRFLFDPLADVYGFVVPRPVRRSVLRFFENLGEPAVFFNEVLQLNPERAGLTSVRFVVNTTVGVGGLFDPARHIGLARNQTDFGETLGVYGIGQGWYLVIPLIGPSSVRDLVGDLVNGFMHPQNYFLAYAPQAILATSSGFSRYEASRTQLEALRDSSVDFYAAMRSAYLRQREADVRAARADSPVLGRGEGDVAAAADHVPVP